MHRKVRRFRFYAKREDLQAILEEFQSKFDVYYVPTYSDEGPVFFKDAVGLPDLGTNFFGSHKGNKQILAFSGTIACSWKEYRWRDHEKGGIRYTSLCDENIERIDIDLNGVYQEKAIFPTEIATLHYDNAAAKKLFDGLKIIVRRQSVKTVNGCFICKGAYEDKEIYRFCTIDIKSPEEYDLKVE